MKVLYVASEALPFIASGGLADVAGALPKEFDKVFAFTFDKCKIQQFTNVEIVC